MIWLINSIMSVLNIILCVFNRNWSGIAGWFVAAMACFVIYIDNYYGEK